MQKRVDIPRFCAILVPVMRDCAESKRFKIGADIVRKGTAMLAVNESQNASCKDDLRSLGRKFGSLVFRKPELVMVASLIFFVFFMVRDAYLIDKFADTGIIALSGSPEALSALGAVLSQILIFYYPNLADFYGLPLRPEEAANIGVLATAGVSAALLISGFCIKRHNNAPIRIVRFVCCLIAPGCVLQTAIIVGYWGWEWEVFLYVVFGTVIWGNYFLGKESVNAEH